MSEDVHFQEIPYGFEYGSAEVTRICSDKKKGWVLMKVDTPRGRVEVYVTKTGKIRVWKDSVEMKVPKNEGVK